MARSKDVPGAVSIPGTQVLLFLPLPVKETADSRCEEGKYKMNLG